MGEFKILLPRAEETIKEVYTDYEVQQLIKKPNIKTYSFSELRNWAMVCYFLATGNRLGTVASIRIGDLNLRDNEILIRKTKQKKQYILPISTELKAVLREYLQYRKGNANDFFVLYSLWRAIHQSDKWFIGYLKDNREVNNISINSHLTNVRTLINYCIRLGLQREFKITSLKAEKR